ncbi:MAG: hypothetical protein GY835_18610 [bacterium]|nr:hypothetical protein [bacterium]
METNVRSAPRPDVMFPPGCCGAAPPLSLPAQVPAWAAGLIRATDVHGHHLDPGSDHETWG